MVFPEKAYFCGTKNIRYDMKLFYRSLGKGQPLLILHGLWGASDNWLPVARLLEGRFQVILPDLRNHGQSPHDPLMDYAALGEDVLQLVESLQLPRPLCLAGHSMGGKTVMRLLLHERGLAARAAVIDIAPKRYEGHARIHRELLKQAERIPLDTLGTREELRQCLEGRFAQEEMRQFYLKNIRRDGQGFAWKVNLDALRHNMHAVMGWEEETPALPVRTPVLFVKGEESGYLKEEDARLAQEKYFPCAAFVSIPHARHSIHADQPEALARVLEGFFADAEEVIPK